jgi:hypothetical protein
MLKEKVLCIYTGQLAFLGQCYVGYDGLVM